jgi:hypothetical protein
MVDGEERGAMELDIDDRHASSKDEEEEMSRLQIFAEAGGKVGRAAGVRGVVGKAKPAVPRRGVGMVGPFALDKGRRRRGLLRVIAAVGFYRGTNIYVRRSVGYASAGLEVAPGPAARVWS